MIEALDRFSILGIESLVQQFLVIQVGQHRGGIYLVVSPWLITLGKRLRVNRIHLGLPVLNSGRGSWKVVAGNGQVTTTVVALEVGYLSVFRWQLGPYEYPQPLIT